MVHRHNAWSNSQGPNPAWALRDLPKQGVGSSAALPNVQLLQPATGQKSGHRNRRLVSCDAGIALADRTQPNSDPAPPKPNDGTPGPVVTKRWATPSLITRFGWFSLDQCRTVLRRLPDAAAAATGSGQTGLVVLKPRGPPQRYEHSPTPGRPGPPLTSKSSAAFPTAVGTASWDALNRQPATTRSSAAIFRFVHPRGRMTSPRPCVNFRNPRCEREGNRRGVLGRFVQQSSPIMAVAVRGECSTGQWNPVYRFHRFSLNLEPRYRAQERPPRYRPQTNGKWERFQPHSQPRMGAVAPDLPHRRSRRIHLPGHGFHHYNQPTDPTPWHRRQPHPSSPTPFTTAR